MSFAPLLHQLFRRHLSRYNQAILGGNIGLLFRELLFDIGGVGDYGISQPFSVWRSFSASTNFSFVTAPIVFAYSSGLSNGTL